MDIGLREWLIVIGIIVIAGILFDGWRRMRGSKGKLKFKLDRSLSNLPDIDENNELLGPARVVNRDHEPSLDEGDMPAMNARESNKKRRHDEPYQGDLQLSTDEPVPTLLDPVVGDDDEAEEAPQKEQAPVEEVLVINVIARD